MSVSVRQHISGRPHPQACDHTQGSDSLGMPAPGFGHALSGLTPTGGVAILLCKARAGEGSAAEGARLGFVLRSMSMSIVGFAEAVITEILRAELTEIDRFI